MTRMHRKSTATAARGHQPKHRRQKMAFVAVVLYTVLLLPVESARAANAETCAKVTDLLWAVDEVAAEWSDSTRVNKMAVTRLSMKAMAALGSAKHANGSDSLPEKLITEIEAIRDGVVGDAGQLQSDPDALRPLLSSGLIIIDGMAEACPEADLPNLAAHQY